MPGGGPMGGGNAPPAGNHSRASASLQSHIGGPAHCTGSISASGQHKDLPLLPPFCALQLVLLVGQDNAL